MIDLLKEMIALLRSIDNRLARMESQTSQTPPPLETLRYPADLDGAHHVSEPK